MCAHEAMESLAEALRILDDVGDDDEARQRRARKRRFADADGADRRAVGRRPGNAGRRPGRGCRGRGKGAGKAREAGVASSSAERPQMQRPRGRRTAQKSKPVLKLNKKDRRFVLHASSLNHSGRARTADHLISAPGEARERVAGKGKWKVWTAPAVLRAGFGAEASGQRDVADQIDGAGHTTSGASRCVVSKCILGRQDQGLHDIQKLSDQAALAFYVRNIMWDETSFDLRWERGGRSVTHSVLCSHAQVAYRVSQEAARDVPELHGPGTRDQHVLRVPQVLPRYNAQTIWEALHRLAGGLQQSCAAKLKATLTSCDAHRANLKVLRKLHVGLPQDHLLLVGLCTQHRAANVIEALTKAVGNLTGVFCLSKVFNYQNVLSHLRKHVHKHLQQVADRVGEPPAGNLRLWQEGASCARELVALCKACMEPQGDGAKKNSMEQLAEFFQGPWTGPRAQGLSRAVSAAWQGSFGNLRVCKI